MSQIDIRDSDRDEHGRASKPDPADELDALMYERFARADYERFHTYLNRLHDECYALRQRLAVAQRGATTP